MAVKFARRLISVEEYHKMGEVGILKEQGLELINGEIVTMSPVGSNHASIVEKLKDFLTTPVDGFVTYYVDKARDVLAINAAEEQYRGKFAAAQHRFNGEEGTYALTLFSMQETDGESAYTVSINGKEVLKTKNAATKIDYSVHEAHAPQDMAPMLRGSSGGGGAVI